MANQTTFGIVVKTADYRENDRMLTLLTPQFGRIDTLARGCRKPGSPLLSAGELFTFGEFVLYTGKERSGVVSCAVQDNFYPIREDYDKLRFAGYMLQVAACQIQPAQYSRDLFVLLLRSLKRIAYMDLDFRAVCAAFLLMDAAVLGYRPVLDGCVHCGQAAEGSEHFLFDLENGGLCCRDCASPLMPAPPVSQGEIHWMRDVYRVGIEKTACPPCDAPLSLLVRYIENKLDIHLPSSKGIR